jgi:hypothetical protein
MRMTHFHFPRTFATNFRPTGWQSESTYKNISTILIAHNQGSAQAVRLGTFVFDIKQTRTI